MAFGIYNYPTLYYVILAYLYIKGMCASAVFIALATFSCRERENINFTNVYVMYYVCIISMLFFLYHSIKKFRKESDDDDDDGATVTH